MGFVTKVTSLSAGTECCVTVISTRRVQWKVVGERDPHGYLYGASVGIQRNTAEVTFSTRFKNGQRERNFGKQENFTRPSNYLQIIRHRMTKRTHTRCSADVKKNTITEKSVFSSSLLFRFGRYAVDDSMIKRFFRKKKKVINILADFYRVIDFITRIQYIRLL